MKKAERVTNELFPDNGSDNWMVAPFFQDGYETAERDIMEHAIEGEVCILPGGMAYVKEKNNDSLKQYLLEHFKTGDEVMVAILPKDDEQ